MGPYPRILVVEDDPITLLTFTLGLQAEGFEVLGALSAREGQVILLTNKGVVAMVVDLDLAAGRAITDLIDAAERLKPAPALIYTAGRPDTRPPGGVSTAAVLIKPCTPRTLAQRVRGALSGT